MRRHSTYREDLAAELRDKTFASEFILTLMEGEDGLDLMTALKHTIRMMGIKEFARAAKMNVKSVSRMLASPMIPKLETLDQYLAPFGLRVRLVPEKKAA
jgi:DNA-binding phage protein